MYCKMHKMYIRYFASILTCKHTLKIQTKPLFALKWQKRIGIQIWKQIREEISPLVLNSLVFQRQDPVCDQRNTKTVSVAQSSPAESLRCQTTDNFNCQTCQPRPPTPSSRNLRWSCQPDAMWGLHSTKRVSVWTPVVVFLKTLHWPQKILCHVWVTTWISAQGWNDFRNQCAEWNLGSLSV